MAQNSLELKLPSGSLHHSMQNKELSHQKGKKKKRTLMLIMLSSQLVQPLADLQNSLPQPFKR